MPTHPTPRHPAIGQPWPEQGGTLGAIIGSGADARAIIVCDAAHEFTGAWGRYGQNVAGATSRTDGLGNTNAMAAAGSTTATRVRALQIGGHADWYIPARNEALALEEQAAGLFAKDWYWTSTQNSRDGAVVQGFEFGHPNWDGKDGSRRVRAVRSIQLEHFAPLALAAEGGAPGFLQCDGAALATLEREIATQAAWTDLECIAVMVRPASGGQGPQYDLTRLPRPLGDDPEVEASERAHLAKAVQYLDLRGLLVRPVPGQPHIVSISRELLDTVQGGAA